MVNIVCSGWQSLLFLFYMGMTEILINIIVCYNYEKKHENVLGICKLIVMTNAYIMKVQYYCSQLLVFLIHIMKIIYLGA